MNLLDIVRMYAFAAGGNICKRFWDKSVHEVRPCRTHGAIYHNALLGLLVVMETQVYNIDFGKLWIY